MDECWSFWLLGVNQKVKKKEWKTYISMRMIDGGGKNPIFHELWAFFFTASNAQKIKMKSIFHKWEDQMI